MSERKRSTSAVRLKPMLRKGITEANARKSMIAKSVRGEWVGTLPLCRVEELKRKAAAEEAARMENERKNAEAYKNTSASIHDVVRLAKMKHNGIDNTDIDDSDNTSHYGNPLRARWRRYRETQEKMKSLWEAKLAKQQAEEAARKAAEIEHRRLHGLLDSENEEDEVDSDNSSG